MPRAQKIFFNFKRIQNISQTSFDIGLWSEPNPNNFNRIGLVSERYAWALCLMPKRDLQFQKNSKDIPDYFCQGLWSEPNPNVLGSPYVSPRAL